MQVARLHGLIQHDDRTTLGAALEGLEIETIAGHEVLLVTPFAMVLALSRHSRLGNGSFLVSGDMLLVVHGWRLDETAVWGNESKRKTGEANKKDSAGTRRALMSVGISRGASRSNLSPFHVELVRGASDRDPSRLLMHGASVSDGLADRRHPAGWSLDRVARRVIGHVSQHASECERRNVGEQHALNRVAGAARLGPTFHSVPGPWLLSKLCCREARWSTRPLESEMRPEEDA